MLDPKNVSNIVGGLTRDPESPTDNLIKFSIAVDYAGSDKGSDNSTGYFDVVYWTNNSDNARNAKFIRDQVSSGKLKKGSQVHVLGRLVQERWTADDDSKKSKVVIVAEAVTYSGSRAATTDGATASAQAVDVPSDF